jgi:hypothetical protein
MTRTIRLFAVGLCLGCSTGIIEDQRDPVREPPGAAASERIAGKLVMAVVNTGDSAVPEYFLEQGEGNWTRLLFDQRPDLYHPHPYGVIHDGHDGPPVGAEVRVSGQRETGGAVQVLELDVMRMPPSEYELVAQEVIAPTPKKVAVILAVFSNDTAPPMTPDAVRAMVFTDAKSTNSYFKEVSFGVRSLVGKVRADGDVFGWYTLAASNNPCDYQNWGTAARQAAQGAGVDLTGYDHVVHYFKRSSACSFSGVGQVPGKYTWINGSSASTISHELGHNFNLHHASSLSCTENGARVPIGGSCTLSEYGDPFDVMGGGFRHFSAFQKGRLGWLEAPNMVTATADGTFTVVPIEQKSASGIQSLRVKIDATKFYYVEFRQPFGFDNFSATSAVVNGVLIHRGTDYTTLSRPELLDMVTATTSFTDAALAVGQTFTDAAANIKIGVTAVSAAGATVTVDVPGGSCTPTTCQALGATCGTPSNGCGGTLACGSCGPGQVCSSTFQCVGSGGGGPQMAAYDATLKAPRCSAAGSSCDAGTLVNGRAALGPEPNLPNTLGGTCLDGTQGAYHTDESIDRIKVVSVDGSNLAAGKMARIEATVWVWGAAQDRLDLYYSASASTPSWTLIGTVAPTASGLQTLTGTYALPAGAQQAVRGSFRYQGTASPCGSGSYNDRDDLIFAVQ